MPKTTSAGAKYVEDSILELCKQFPDGLRQSDIDSHLGHLDLKERVDALNSLLAKHRLQLFTSDGAIVYKDMRHDADAMKLRGLSGEEILVYQTIKNSGTMGVWTKDLKSRTNLAQPQVTKVLKVLEARRLVKSVKHVNNPSRKVYMLFELEPAREVTGGAWYSENQFDSEFIAVLRDAVLKFVRRSSDATLEQIAAFVRGKGFSKVELQLDDIRCVVDTLVYDGRVDQVDGEEDDEEHFRPTAMPLPQSTPLTSLPCGICPVFAECGDGGLISPQTCVYYDTWLDF